MTEKEKTARNANQKFFKLGKTTEVLTFAKTARVS
jgi:ssRNA-specific RNase YbeY (16S rRNA maturation enzyme)